MSARHLKAAAASLLAVAMLTTACSAGSGSGGGSTGSGGSGGASDDAITVGLVAEPASLDFGTTDGAASVTTRTSGRVELASTREEASLYRSR